MASTPDPAAKGGRWQQWTAMAVVFSFTYLALTAAGELGGFPHAYAPVAPPSAFDTSWMVLADRDPTPLDLAWGNSTSDTLAGAPILTQELTFLSERLDGIDVRIFGAVVRYAYNGTVNVHDPGIVLVHGYGGSHLDMMPAARELAARHYVALAIDAPDSGRSTPYPARTPEGLVNVTADPRGGFFFHVAYAASRTLTVLESLPYVAATRLGVLGASQGGFVTMYLAAKDGRVRAAMPMIPGGDLGEAFAAPSLVHLLLPRDATPADPRLEAFRRYYDPLGYAPLIDIPVLFMAGTNDEFFPLPGVIATYEAIPAQTVPSKFLSLVPNLGHAGYPGWTATVGRFLDSVFRGGPSLPGPALAGVSSDWAGVHVRATAPAGSDVVLVFRESTGADRWRWVPLADLGPDPTGLAEAYSGTASPTWPTTLSLYVAVMDGDAFVTSSPVRTVQAYGATGPSLLVLTALLSAYLLGIAGVRYRERLVPLGAALLSTLGASVAWIGVAGRASWGWYEIADRTPAGGVLLAGFLVFFAGLITASLLRPRLMLLLSWIPLAFSLAAVGIAAGLLGGAVTVVPSWGLLPILASPFLVLLERRWRKGKEPRVF